MGQPEEDKQGPDTAPWDKAEAQEAAARLFGVEGEMALENTMLMMMTHQSSM